MGMTTSVVERTRLLPVYRRYSTVHKSTYAVLPILYAFAPSCIIMHYASFRDCNGLSDNSGAIQYRIRVRSDGLLRLHLAVAFDITRTNYVFQLFLPLLSRKEMDGTAVMIMIKWVGHSPGIASRHGCLTGLLRKACHIVRS